MNKKFKIFMVMSLAILLGAFNTNATFAQPDFNKPMPEERMQDKSFKPHNPQMHKHKHPSVEEFEKRLNLTEEQKTLAKAQREESIKKIKPILDEINTKKAEIEAVQKTRMAQRAIDERVSELQGEIRELRKQAHKIRKDNMKAFEASLSEEQLKELQKMKDEGRKRFEEMNRQSRRHN